MVQVALRVLVAAQVVEPMLVGVKAAAVIPVSSLQLFIVYHLGKIDG